ncbi:TRAP transporter small permease [Anaeroselena agilis]|uniref:TRAP transporter small permease n=1 Tax=Anaeroselena agilis TaxID=3063788 RepID=A0ABU3NT11_9FIRM|nr:TRAP transporter small permease [Selenomonadales bacterium 4137-cl]
MLQLIRRVNDILLKGAGWGTVFFMAVMAIVIPYEVFGRCLLARMSTWSGEVSTFSLVWASMLGGAVGLRKGYQVGMTAALDALPPVVAKMVRGLGFIFMFIFLGVMIYYGASQTLANAAQRSPAMQIPMCYPYAALPVGFLLMLLVTIEDLLVFLGLGPAKEEQA